MILKIYYVLQKLLTCILLGNFLIKKFPQYTIKLYGQGNDSLDLYLIDEHTIYVKDALSGNIVKIDSDELWKFIGSIIK